MPTLRLEINAAVNGIALTAGGHANEMKFKGILVQLDTPSTKAPNGSQGKRIMIPSSTAKTALHTLINMGLNYTDKLDGHNPRKKVGVIKKAWIEGNSIHVSGIVWKKDFPETETDLKKKNLGMSFEATDIGVEDEKAPVWKITKMCFTGASILYKKDAAYNATEALAAAKLKSAASQITKIQGGISMAHKEKSKVPAKKTARKVSANGGDSIGPEVIAGLTEALSNQTKAFSSMASSIHSLRSELHVMAAQDHNVVEEESESLEAAAEESESQESESSSSISAGFPDKKKKKKDDEESESEGEGDDSESMSADADDSGDLGEMESDEPEPGVGKPGALNHKAKQKGDQTKVEDEIGKEVDDPILGSSLKKLSKIVNELKAARADDQKKIKKLERSISEQKTQITAAAGKTERRSISALSKALLTKGGMDPDAIQASGRKLSISEVDELLAAAKLEPVQRMDIKGQWARAGIMDEGIMSRTQVN